MPLGPIERGGGARRPSEIETVLLRTVPDLLRHEVAGVGRGGHRLKVEAGRAAVREFVLAAFARQDRPRPSKIPRASVTPIGVVDGKAAAVVVVLAIIVVIVAMKVGVAVNCYLHRRVSVLRRSSGRERRRHFGVIGQENAEPDEIEEPKVGHVMTKEAALLETELSLSSFEFGLDVLSMRSPAG